MQSVSSCFVCFFFFKQKTAYELRISDWSSDVCSSDLRLLVDTLTAASNAQRGKAPETRLLFRVVFRLLAAKVLQDRHHPYAQGWDAADLASILRAIESYYRSEERRVGKECVRTCRSGWSPYHKKKKKAHKQTDK